MRTTVMSSLIIYMYIMGFLMSVMAFSDDRTFRVLPWWTRSLVLAGWPLVLPLSLIVTLASRGWKRLTYKRGW